MSRSADVRYTFTPTASSIAFDVVSFVLDESLSADGLSHPGHDAPLPFRLSIDLSAFDDNVDFSHLVDAPAHFAIWHDDTVVRHVWGIVTAWEQGDSGFHRTRYRAVVEPALARLTLRSGCRMFQQKSVPDILAVLLKEHGLSDVQWQVDDTHPPREFCCQWNETDWAFMQRLAADEGILIAVTHDAQRHSVVLTDTTQRLPEGGSLLYQPQAGGTADQPSLRRFHYTEQMAVTRATGRDYTFWNARHRLEQQATPYGIDRPLGQPPDDDDAWNDGYTTASRTQARAGADYESYRYPADYKKDDVGRRATRIRLNAERRHASEAWGEGDRADLMPGTFYTLEGHPRDAWNRAWRVVRLHHEGTQHPSQGEDATEGATTYHQTAVFVPREAEWKAPLWPKPRLDGPLIATVVGPSKEEIYVDTYGRVRLQMPWDREGQDNDASSCWVRVSQGWAGTMYGMQALPRVGHEVIVSFLAGDVDQPIVTGRTHHPGNLPPYTLPAFNAIHTLKSKELQGQRANELRIDDTPRQISAALMSDHGASALHLGYLTHPRPQGGAPRGEGFELRSDEHGAIRAAKGLLLSAWGQPRANGGQLDATELLQWVDQITQQAKSLLEVAQSHQALPAPHDARDRLVQAAHALGAGANDRQDASGNQPVVVMGAPAGLVTATPASVLTTAGTTIESLAQQDHILTAAQRVHVTAGAGISAFSIDGGIRHLANQGDVLTQAQHGTVSVQANEDIRQDANKQFIATAGDTMALQCGKSAIVLHADGRVEIFGTQLQCHADLHVDAPSSLSTALQQWDSTPFSDRFHAQWPDGTPASHQHYEVVHPDGARTPGMTDAEGRITLQKGLNPAELRIVWLDQLHKQV